MSADNGIYLHKFRKGWAVAHLQAIENIYWHAKGKYNYKILREKFKDAKIFKTRNKALDYALNLSRKVDTEYGISEV